ncbi:MAG: vacuolating cytotoxin domain-containing protein [Candidatus Sungbacteria bacterium]|nr:vacuolating cytotoxin domain-containing protein [Candidatus Sungbacteria bacterium]
MVYQKVTIAGGGITNTKTAAKVTIAGNIKTGNRWCTGSGAEVGVSCIFKNTVYKHRESRKQLMFRRC